MILRCSLHFGTRSRHVHGATFDGYNCLIDHIIHKFITKYEHRYNIPATFALIVVNSRRR
jgi:hypothetical protein